MGPRPADQMSSYCERDDQPGPGGSSFLACDSPIKAPPPEEKEEDHCSKVLARVHSLREHPKLCDVVLRCNEVEIPTHRAILAACSPYFLAMFTHELKESSQSVVDLKDMDQNILSRLVDFAYTGKIDISVDDVQDVLSAASLLQVTEVIELCCTFLKNQLDPHNCLGIRTFAEAHGCQELSQVIDNFVQLHFSEVAKGPEFLQHSCENLIHLISDDQLRVSREEEVFEAVIQWVAHDKEARKPMLSKLLQHVRLPMLPKEYIVRQVDTCDLVRSCMECRDLVDEAKRYHLMPDEHSSMTTNERMYPRKSTVQSLFVVGGKESSDSITRTVECYNLYENRWERAPELLVRRQQLGVGSLGGKIYSVGGSDGSLRLSSVECFDPNAKSWSFVAPMATCRSGVGVGIIGGAMYSAGGYDGRSCLNSVERYDQEKNVWCPVAPMSIKRSFPGVAVVKDKLYMFGGNDGSSFLSIVEMYDPHINRWCNITPLTNPRAGVGVAVLEQCIYVAGGNDGTSRLESVERLDIREGKWHTIAKMKSARDGVSLASLGWNLLAVGGINGPSYLKTTEIYDPRKNVWDFVATMETCRAAAGVATVQL